MSVTYRIALESPLDGVELDVTGEALAFNIEELDDLCDRSRIPRLDTFMGQAVEEFAHLLGPDVDLPSGDEWGAQWFDAKKGAHAVGRMITAIRKRPKFLTNPESVGLELEAYQRILTQASEKKVRWHLALRFAETAVHH